MTNKRSCKYIRENGVLRVKEIYFEHFLEMVESAAIKTKVIMKKTKKKSK